MDTMMLLAGQVLQMQAGEEDEPARLGRSPQFWEAVETLERDIASAWRTAARMLAGFAVLSLLLMSAHSAMRAAASARDGSGVQPSFSPLSAATWSDSIGRYSEPLPIASALAK